VQTIPAVGPRITSTLRTVSRGAYDRWHRLDRTTRAQIFFVLCFVICAIVIYPFASLIFSLYFGNVEILSCANRNAHRAFSVVIAFVVVALSFGWYWTFKGTFRGPTGAMTRAAGLGSAGLIVALIVIQSVPWSLMWKGSDPRVLLDGQRGYLLVETPVELVIRNVERRTTEVRPNGPANGIERLGVGGYVFEEPAAFYSGLPDCTALTTSNPQTGASP
jgi:hypothetical protein